MEVIGTLMLNTTTATTSSSGGIRPNMKRISLKPHSSYTSGTRGETTLYQTPSAVADEKKRWNLLRPFQKASIGSTMVIKAVFRRQSCHLVGQLKQKWFLVALLVTTTTELLDYITKCSAEECARKYRRSFEENDFGGTEPKSLPLLCTKVFFVTM